MLQAKRRWQKNREEQCHESSEAGNITLRSENPGWRERGGDKTESPGVRLVTKDVKAPAQQNIFGIFLSGEKKGELYSIEQDTTFKKCLCVCVYYLWREMMYTELSTEVYHCGKCDGKK